MASKRVKDGPHWVKAWISELSALTDQFRDMDTGAVDFEALGREEYHFRMALSRRDFTNSERARKVWEDAVGNYQQRIKAASKEKVQGDASHSDAEDESVNVSDSTAVQITPGILAAISDREGQQTRTEEGIKAPVFSPSSKPSSVRNVQLPRNKQEVVEFAIDNGLDTDDASTWAEINLKERKGKDKDGKPIMNWKGALTNYCKAMADKRREPA